MFREEIDMAGNAAKKKIQFLRHNRGILHLSDAGGNVCWIWRSSGIYSRWNVKRRRRAGCEVYYGRLLWRCPQSGLMAGAELFTGSNFVMAVGMFQKRK